MNVHEFVQKWSQVSLTERSASQQHFLTGTRTEVHELPLAELAEPRNFEILRAVFESPVKLKPGTTIEAITQEAAGRVAAIAESLRSRGLDPHEVARFLDRIVFALFAEDVGLLPPELFSRLIRQSRRRPELFRRFTTELFRAMATGDYWALDRIRHFDGNLFDVAPVLTLTVQELESIAEAAKLDWSAVDPSIFGTLFERGMDPDKRSQLGAHYTSREDIETLVDPVVMQPLRRQWDEVRRVVENLLATGRKEPPGKEKVPEGGLQGPALKKARVEADLLLRRFWERLGQVKVLDPPPASFPMSAPGSSTASRSTPMPTSWPR